MLKLINIKQQMIGIDNKDKAIQILSENLYSIEPVIEDINRELLSLAYTPGVGAVCLDIQEKESLAD
jgi:malic enzyme